MQNFTFHALWFMRENVRGERDRVLICKSEKLFLKWRLSTSFVLDGLHSLQMDDIE